MLRLLVLIIAVLSFVVIGVGLVREHNKKCRSGEIKYVPKNLVNDGNNIEDIRKYMRDGSDEELEHQS